MECTARQQTQAAWIRQHVTETPLTERYERFFTYSGMRHNDPCEPGEDVEMTVELLCMADSLLDDEPSYHLSIFPTHFDASRLSDSWTDLSAEQVLEIASQHDLPLPIPSRL
jgi:hypothetical protein